MVEAAIKNAGLKVSDVDWLLLHQANIRIMEHAAKVLDISMDKVLRNIAEYGNTSAGNYRISTVLFAFYCSFRVELQRSCYVTYTVLFLLYVTGSIPLALAEAVKAGKVKKGDIIAISGFGAGLNWGAAVIKWG